MIKEMIRRGVYLLFSIMNKIIPKKKQVFIYGGEYLLDNSEAMLRYLINSTEVKVLCIADKRMEMYNDYDTIHFKKNTFFNSLICLLTSRIVLESSLHRIKVKPAHNQFIIQMWHGSPLKHLPENKAIKNGNYYTHIFYGADLFEAEMRNSFSADRGKMVLAGFPRNDYLFAKRELPLAYQSKGKAVIWLPTFRRGIGLIESSIDLPIITTENLVKLDHFLKEKEIRLFIKPHPLQIGGLEEVISDGNLSAISLITDDQLRTNNIALYELIGNMDALITDYSSVFFDYLLINRPIGFTVEDMKEYASNRGFALSPPEEYMPGEKIHTYQELIGFFNDLVSGIDKYKEKREQVNSVVNYYKDNTNCYRCASLFLDQV